MDFQAQEKATAGIFKFLASAITIGVISLLLAVTINPIEFVRFQRDRQRTRDLKSLSDLILKVEEAVPQAIRSVGNFVYLSLPDNDPNCGSWLNNGLPPIPSGYVYRCVNDVNLTRTDGYGWLPINFKELPGFSLSKLPVDPRNGTVGYDSEKEREVLYFYQYVAGSAILSANQEGNQYEPLVSDNPVENSFGFTIEGSIDGSNGINIIGASSLSHLAQVVRKAFDVKAPEIEASFRDLAVINNLSLEVAVAQISKIQNDFEEKILALERDDQGSGGSLAVLSPNLFISFGSAPTSSGQGESSSETTSSASSSESNISESSSGEANQGGQGEISDTQPSEAVSDEQNFSNTQSTSNDTGTENEKICLNLGGMPSGSGGSFRCSIQDAAVPSFTSSSQNVFPGTLPTYVLIPRDYKFYKEDFTSMTSGQNDALNWSAIGKPNKINLIYGVVNEGFVDVPAGALSFKLEQAPLVGGLACNNLDGWSDVTSASRPIAYDTLSNFSDDSPIIGTVDGLKMGVSEVLQTWQSQGGLTNAKPIKKGQAGVFGFNLRVNGADPQGIDCLRIVFADGSLLYYYSPALPELVFSDVFPTPPDFNTNNTSSTDPATTNAYQQYMLWLQQHYPGSTSSSSTTSSSCVNSDGSLKPNHTVLMPGFECMGGVMVPIGSVSFLDNSQILASPQFDKKLWKKFFASVYDVFSAFDFLKMDTSTSTSSVQAPTPHR